LHRGILNSLRLFSDPSVGAKAAAAIMLIIGVMFGIAAAVNMLILLKVISHLILTVLSLPFVYVLLVVVGLFSYDG